MNIVHILLIAYVFAQTHKQCYAEYDLPAGRWLENFSGSFQVPGDPRVTPAPANSLYMWPAADPWSENSGFFQTTLICHSDPYYNIKTWGMVNDYFDLAGHETAGNSKPVPSFDTIEFWFRRAGNLKYSVGWYSHKTGATDTTTVYVPAYPTKMWAVGVEEWFEPTIPQNWYNYAPSTPFYIWGFTITDNYGQNYFPNWRCDCNAYGLSMQCNYDGKGAIAVQFPSYEHLNATELKTMTYHNSTQIPGFPAV